MLRHGGFRHQWEQSREELRLERQTELLPSKTQPSLMRTEIVFLSAGQRGWGGVPGNGASGLQTECGGWGQHTQSGDGTADAGCDRVQGRSCPGWARPVTVPQLMTDVKRITEECMKACGASVGGAPCCFCLLPLFCPGKSRCAWYARSAAGFPRGGDSCT